MFGVICRRNWALRLSIVLNVCVLLYVCAHFGAVSGPWIEDTSGWASNGPPPSQEMLYGTAPRPNGTATSSAQTEPRPPSPHQEQEQPPAPAEPVAPVRFKANETKSPLEPGASEAERRPNQTANQNIKKELTLQEAILCNDKSTEPKTAQRGDYWVLYNYVPMNMKVHCWESVTYTTHADYTFLDNLEPLLERWRGPISIALHAPGTDFPATIEAIKHARSCGSPLVAQLVTFHVYFSSKHVPKMIER